MTEKRNINIGVIGAGFMGQAHAKALHTVGATFNTTLRPVLDMICTTTIDGAKKNAQALGFNRWTDDWQVMINDSAIEAIIIATPQNTHRDIALAAFKQGKAVFCEKPMGLDLDEAQQMADAAKQSALANMIGFNYIRTPASQLAYEMIQNGEIGEVYFFRGEHTEDFFADANMPADWRTRDKANGNMGDLAPHIINAALRLVGVINSVTADLETVYKTRPTQNDSTQQETVTNDDQASILCRFENGALGNLFVSRVATGKKMGYMYEIYGTKGTLKLDQEDQNTLWFYPANQASNRAGFNKIITGPEHPDFNALCPAVGHGTGYQEQIIIEMRDFLLAIETGQEVWPTFADGVAVRQVMDAAWQSNANRSWQTVD